MTNPKLFTREFILVAGIAFFSSMNFQTLAATIPKYAIEVFDMSETLAGLASGLYVGGQMISRMIAGRFVNRVGVRPMLFIGCIGLVVFSLGYFVADVPSALFLVRFFNGFFYGMTSVTCVTIISIIIPRERSGEGIAYFTIFPMIAWGIGPYFGVNFSEAGNYTALFLLCTIAPGIGLLLIPFIRAQKTIMAEAANTEKNISLFDKFFEKPVIPLALATLLMTLFFTAVTGFAAVYAKTINLSDVSLFFLFFAVSVIAIRPLIGKLFDKYGGTMILIPGVFIMAAGYVVFSQISSLQSIIISAVLFGISNGIIQTVTLTLVVKRTARERLGTANATYYLFLDISAVLGPFIGGMIIEGFGYTVTFITGAVVLVIGLLVYLRFVREE